MGTAAVDGVVRRAESMLEAPGILPPSLLPDAREAVIAACVEGRGERGPSDLQAIRVLSSGRRAGCPPRYSRHVDACDKGPAIRSGMSRTLLIKVVGIPVNSPWLGCEEV